MSPFDTSRSGLAFAVEKIIACEARPINDAELPQKSVFALTTFSWTYTSLLKAIPAASDDETRGLY
jgi:hypothetical protein